MPGTTPKLALPYPLGTDRVADGDDAIKALAERVETVSAGDFIPMAVVAPWGNHSAGEYAGYRLVGNRLELRGLIASGALGTPAFVLPVGYRPTKDRYIATASNNVFGLLIISATGAVTPAVGSPTWFSLDVSCGIGPP
jgi:hypothetical protein